MNQDYVKIDDRFKAMFICLTIFGFITLFLPLITVAIICVFFRFTITNTSNFGIFIFLQVFLAIFMIPILFKHFKDSYPPYEVAFLAYENKFEFRIHNRIYKKFLWDDIKKLEFAKERHSMLTSGKNDIKMKIYTINTIEEIRLYLMKFRKINIEEIKSVIKDYANSRNINVLELIDYVELDFEDRTRECQEIKAFIKKVKNLS